MKNIDVKPTPDAILDAFVEFYNEEIADYDVDKISKSDAYIVWFCYIVGNAKALISTVRPDHMYYELTYHVEKNQLHVDMYTKIRHTSYDIN